MNRTMVALLSLALIGSSSVVEMRLLRFPAVYGDRVVFSYASDLWSWKEGEGPARRLTSHPNSEFRAKISPDGKLIAFTASYDGNNEVYVMPVDGGEPKRLTFEPQNDQVECWTPDGKIAYVSSAGSNTDNHPRLWLVSPKGGLPESTPILESVAASFSPDGSKVAYQRMSGNGQNWRQYRGGRQSRISIYDLKANQYSEIPIANENAFSPLWVGTSIYFLSDRDEDAVNLFRYDLGSKKTVRLTEFKDAMVKWADTDGKTIVLERDGGLFSYDLSTKNLDKLNPTVNSENLAARPALRRLASQIGRATLSPAADKIAVEARGEIFTLDPKNGEAVNLTRSSGARDTRPLFSPDGKTLAYFSDKSGEYELYTVPVSGGSAAQATTGLGTFLTGATWSPDSKKIAVTNRAHELKVIDVASKKVTLIADGGAEYINGFSWSPDSNWIAYVAVLPNENNAIFVHDLRAGKTTQVTSGEFSDQDVAFDPGGRYLYVLSARIIDPASGSGDVDVTRLAFKQAIYAIALRDDVPSPTEDSAEGREKRKPEEFRIDLNGIGARMVQLPFPVGTYFGLFEAKDGVYAAAPNLITGYTLGAQGIETYYSGPWESASANDAGTKFIVLAGGNISMFDLKPGQKPGSGRIDTSNIEAVINPKEEWNQIFWEAWRFERDNFYDKDLRGLNWKAVGDHYASMLPYVAHRSDLTYIIGLMIAELRTSHTYVQEGDTWISQPPLNTGLLGVDYETANGKVRLKRIYRGASYDESARGPLAILGKKVKEGDYLLEIDGQPVDDKTNPHLFLVNKVGKWVTLTLNDRPSLEGARKFKVKPIGSESNLRYYEWVEWNRQYVDKASGGKIGYMHVPDTAITGSIGFVNGLYRNQGKQALIVDERNNHGGYNPTFFIEKLTARIADHFAQRYGPDIAFPQQAVDVPKAMLINGYAGSGGDLFPYLFRKAKVGPLIGTRTWGGAVGLDTFYALVDGGTVTAPEFAWYDPDTGQWIAENEGLTPDIAVDLRPDHELLGKDPQLDKAIEYLLGQIQKNPRKVLRPEVKKIGR